MTRRRIALLFVTAALAGCADDGADEDTTTTVAAGSRDSTAPPNTTAPSPPPTAPSAAGSTARSTAGSTGTVAATDPPATPAAAAPLGDPEVELVEVATLEEPIDLAWRSGDDGRYLAEQPGRVTRLAPGGEVRTVLDITDLTESQGEQGLLGLVFSPDGTLGFVHYSDDAGDTVIASMPVDADGNFDRDSMAVVYTTEQPYPNHNGGDMAFGPDDMLYIGLGDGGSGGDPERRATDLTSPLGKLLRIDPTPADDPPYRVPPDNPYVDDADALPEIWSSGLRNPWKFSFDPATGDLWIADVGQNAFEEIDVAPATDGLNAGRGLSFGWSAFEGDARYNDDVPAEGHTPPVFTYGHDSGCSISGGARYRGEAIPALAGRFVYADYCSGEVWALALAGEGDGIAAGGVVTLANVSSPTAVVAGSDGELYVLSRDGPVYAVQPP